MYNKENKLLLVNETFIIDESIHDEWLSWFKNEYLSAIKNSGLTSDYILSKMDEKNPDGITYAFQFKIKDSDFAAFQNKQNLVGLRGHHDTKFINKYASFVTVLEIIAD